MIFRAEIKPGPGPGGCKRGLQLCDGICMSFSNNPDHWFVLSKRDVGCKVKKLKAATETVATVGLRAALQKHG